MEVGAQLRSAIESLGKQDIVDVRGSGLLAGVQLTGGALADWNLVVGFGFIIGGVVLSTRWR